MQSFIIITSAVAELALISLAIWLYERGRRTRDERDRLMREKEVLLGFVHDVGEVFSDAENVELNSLLEKVLYYGMRTTQASSGVIYYLDDDGLCMRARAVAGLVPPLTDERDSGLEQAISKSQHLEDYIKSRVIKLGDGIIGEVLQFGNPILIEDAEYDPRIPQYGEAFLKIRTLLAVPLVFRHKALGVMALINRTNRQPFTHENVNLMQGLADQASVSAHYLGLREMLLEKQRIDHDLNVARQIQSNLLPAKLPEIPGLDIAALNLPALEIGGDYYDVITIDNDHVGFTIADVSGKGIPGAILMSICRSVLRAISANEVRPLNVVKQLNHIISPDISEEMFVTMNYLCFQRSTRELSVTRAGHEKTIIFRRESRQFEFVDSEGIALGLLDTAIFDQKLREKKVELQTGDIILLYTDGITEAMNADGDEWGLERFLEVVKLVADENAREILDAVHHRVLRFMGETGQYDDMTLLAVKVL